MNNEIENTLPTNITEGALALKNEVAIPGHHNAQQLQMMAAANKVKTQPLVLANLANASQCQPHAPIYTAVIGNNSELIRRAEMYLKPGDKIADVTYGKGVFWNDIDRSKYDIHPSDIKTVPEHPHDFTNLPYTNDDFDVVAFDPPYSHNPGKNNPFETQYKNRETTPGLDHAGIINLYRKGMREALRILKSGGLLWVKCQDEIQGGKQRPSLIEIFNIATIELGMLYVDRFVVVNKNGLPIRFKNQKHARKNDSYLWIFQKPQIKKAQHLPQVNVAAQEVNMYLDKAEAALAAQTDSTVAELWRRYTNHALKQWLPVKKKTRA